MNIFNTKHFRTYIMLKHLKLSIMKTKFIEQLRLNEGTFPSFYLFYAMLINVLSLQQQCSYFCRWVSTDVARHGNGKFCQPIAIDTQQQEHERALMKMSVNLPKDLSINCYLFLAIASFLPSSMPIMVIAFPNDTHVQTCMEIQFLQWNVVQTISLTFSKLYCG